MRKEIIISILIGLGLGLVITYGFYNAKLATTAENMTQKSEIDAVATDSADTTNGKLVIINPEEELVTTEHSLAVMGSVNPGDFLVLFVDDEPAIVSVESDGKFSTTITLDDVGPHTLTLHAVDENGSTVTETRTVIVQAAPTSATTNEASDSAKLSPTPTRTGTKTPSPTPTRAVRTPTPTTRP